MRLQLLRTIVLVSLLSVAAYGASRITIMKMGGDIDVDDAPLGASLYTMGGDIHIRHASREVSAKTMGGNIEVRQLDGSLDARSMGGTIQVHAVGTGSARNITLCSMGGDIELVVPRDFDAAFSVEIIDEDHQRHTITSDFPLPQSETSRWSLFHDRTRTLLGKSAARNTAIHVDISTHAGNVTIRKE